MTVPRRQVEVETVFRLIFPDTPALSIRVRMRYSADDPYAVETSFLTDDGWISWCIGRELLVAGLDEPAGFSDVRVWPWHTPRGDFVALALSPPDCNALFEVPRTVLVRFLRRTYVVVPCGRETDNLDIDGAIERLLAGR